PPGSPVVGGRYTCRRAPPVTRVSGDHISGSRALVISEVIHLQVRTQVRDNVPRCRASTLPPLHTASMSDLRGSPPTRGGQIAQELPRRPERLGCRRHITSMLPAPRPLRGRSVQHGPVPYVAR